VCITVAHREPVTNMQDACGAIAGCAAMLLFEDEEAAMFLARCEERSLEEVARDASALIAARLAVLADGLGVHPSELTPREPVGAGLVETLYIAGCSILAYDEDGLDACIYAIRSCGIGAMECLLCAGTLLHGLYRWEERLLGGDADRIAADVCLALAAR
jgi:hypothetical protein